MPSGRTYKEERYIQIIEEQTAISYASKGISIADTDEMSPIDRKIVLDSIKKIKEAEQDQIEKAKSNSISTSKSASRYSRGR